MQKTILLIVVTLLWIFSLILFKKTKMNFFKFLAGSVGIFTISMIFFLPYLEGNLNVLISNTLNIIGRSTNYFQVFKENSIVSVDTRDGIVSIFINYECSGVIEMLVFTSLALFFPFGGRARKILLTVGGNIFIFLANIIRVLFIIFVTKTLGASAFYLAHTLLARILFFVLMIILYYFVFTATHLRYQNVGDIK
jgi:exosortase family protein XrtG